jgi:SecD/SecF fusion protein
MSTLMRNGLIVLAVLVLSVWAITPPEQTLRLGKDLAGGASLIYGVEVRPGEGSEIIERVKQVVKERLDPQGVLEISVVAQGTDRLEITMPLPGEEVKKLRAAFEAELAKFTAVSISQEEFDAQVQRSPEARADWIKTKVGSDEVLALRLQQAFRDADAAAKARLAVTQALADEQKLRDAIRNETAPETDPTVVNLKAALELAKTKSAEAIDAAAKANIALEATRSASLSTGLSAADLRRALLLDNKPIKLLDRNKQPVVRDSPRQAALKAIEERYPDQKAGVERVIAAWNEFQAKRRSLDDPEDIVRILRGAGVLNFRIAVQPGENPQEQDLRQALREKGPTGTPPASEARWYKVNKLENWVQTVEELDELRKAPAVFFAGRGLVADEYKGQPYILLWDRPGSRLLESDGQVSGARQGMDQLGRPAIDFTMEPIGAAALGDLTGRNVGKLMAVLLDDEVYTAPRLQSRISSQGQITGSFSQAELDYVIRVLSAGSLQAKLSPGPLSKSVLGPQLGAENLERGLHAGIVAFILVGVFMVFYYFWCGLIAMAGLILNLLMILGAMALNHAAFTLPGIAGVILTFGMAVDANVLVYERMREERAKGADARTAVRLGHAKALSAIVDGNVTTLIVCVVLGLTGTQEIKGFALTLGIGNVTTLFAQLFATRFLFNLMVDRLHWRSFSMLPMVNNNWLGKRLIPNIDWMGLRYITMAISIVLTGIGVFFLAYEGRELLGTEFRGGTSVTMVLRPEPGQEGQPDPKRITMTRAEVEDAVKAIGQGRDAADPLSNLKFAEIIAVNPEEDRTSSTFTVRTLVTDAELLQRTLVGAFADKLDSRPALTFAGSNGRTPVAFPLTTPELGTSIERPGVRQPVGDFRGGVAIVLDNLSPRPSIDALRERLALKRSQPDFQDVSGRTASVVLLAGTDSAVESAAVLVKDPTVSYFEDVRRWETDVRDREWALVNSALTTAQTQAEVQSFSAAVAETFANRAIVSVLLATLLIVIYIWVRFNSFRYSAASIVCTLHDCLVAIGFVGLATVVYRNLPDVAAPLGILPFKIDLNVMAAILTILGYSLNDTVIVMDRIRETRGKLPYATRQIINDAINQTFSRTIITSGLTLLAVLVLYIDGGEGVRVFAYTMLVGIVVGVYSSVAVAAPLVWVRKADPTAGDAGRPRAATPESALAA